MTWVTAIAAPIGMFLVTSWLIPSLGSVPYALLLLPVLASAVMGGVRQGVVTTFIAILLEEYLFDAAPILDRDPWPIVAFALEACAVSVIFELLHRTRRRLQAAQRDLQAYARQRIETADDAASQAIAELRATTEQLRHAQKMEAVGRLAGGVAHDFNNLLGITLSCAELALENDSRGGSREELEDIRSAALRGAELTRQLLTFSRQKVSQRNVIDVGEVVGQMDRMIARLLREDVVVDLRRAPGSLRIEGDVGQLEQLIMNLVVNARDAMPDGGRLTIETTLVNLDAEFARSHVGVTPGPHVMLAVSDTGTGMDAETQARVFEPFFTTKPAGKGTGLGLSTCYGIVRQSGGTIWIESKVGAGTTFTIYLPETATEPLHASTTSREMCARGADETVLLVEDDAKLRRATSAVLARHGYRVLEASDAADALAISERNRGRIHLLLTDVVMPGLSGPVLAERIAGQRPGIGIIFTSGYTQEAILHRHSGAAFLQKPATAHQLLRQIREILSGPDRPSLQSFTRADVSTSRAGVAETSGEMLLT